MDVFNDNLIRLIKNLAKIVPDSVIGTNLDNLLKLLEMSQTKVINGFIKYILPHKVHIHNENVDFFMKFDIEPVFGSDYWTMIIINEIIKTWKILNAKNKQMVFLYLKGLLSIAENYDIDNKTKTI
jgi:hypothetical protein